MTYSQNTIIDVNAANVLAGIMDGLLTNAGWQTVETIVPAGTTPDGIYRNRIYKSPGSSNACGYDWYVAMLWNTVGTEQRFQLIPFGAYDTTGGNKRARQIAAFATATGGNGNPGYNETDGAQSGYIDLTQPTTTDSSYYSHGVNYQQQWFNAIVPSSAFGYWASVTKDHVALFTTIGTGGNTANAFMGSLNRDATYTPGLSFVAPNPIVNIGNSDWGISALVLGQGTSYSTYRRSTMKPAKGVGAPLPILDGAYLDAYAFRPAFYLTAVSGAGGTPPWDNPAFGDGFHIGDVIDAYQVFGGSLGDTVTILGQTYVLAPFYYADNVTMAVRVE